MVEGGEVRVENNLFPANDVDKGADAGEVNGRKLLLRFSGRHFTSGDGLPSIG